MKKLLLALLLAASLPAPSNAQNPGTVTNHAFAIGKGPGVAGFASLLCGSGQLPIGQSAANPACASVSGDGTLSAGGALAVTKTGGIGFGPLATLIPGANVASALALNVGSAGAFVVNGGALGTPSSGNGSNITNIPISNLTGFGTGVASALAINIGSVGSFITNGGVLGSPSSIGTLPAFTLGGTISGGGNQLNNIVIGTATPLAASFTTLNASTSLTNPLDIGGSGTTGTQKTFKTTTGNGTTDQFVFVGGNNGGTTFATLNATGLGIGAAPSSPFNVSTSVVTIASFNTSNSTAVVQVAGSGGSFLLGLGSSTALMQGAGGVTLMQFQVSGGAPTMDVEGGSFKASAHFVKGTVPIGTTGSCTASSFSGGATAGKFTAPTCAGGTIILSALPTAPTGWTCNAQDQTTPANTLKQTANTASSVTFTATTTVSDVVVYKCMGW